MSGAENRAARRSTYFPRLVKLLDEYPNIFIVGVDNVGSAQMSKIRHALRGKAVVLMGKNTMIRKAIREHLENNKALAEILPYVRGNVGFVFFKSDLQGVKKALLELRVAAPAKAGTVAPNDVVVPAGPTGMEPTMTSFLQALNIQSKITRGQVEITNDVQLIKAGTKVGASEANLLGKLDIKPFSYGLVLRTVYENGSIYEASWTEITDEDILSKFQNGVKNLAAISLSIHYPTIASVPHSVVAAFKRVVAIGLATDYSFPKAEEAKKALSSGPAPAAAAPAAASKGAAPAAAKAKEPEPEPEEEEEMGLGMFD